jgi:glycerol-3-phosphate dehydrogenase subunit B
VIGAGLAGLSAAWQAVQQGWQVKVISKGWGNQYWGSGCIDVLGYYPQGSEHAVDSPVGAIARLMLEQPEHPYTPAGIPRLNTALRDFKQLCEGAGYPLHGSLDENWLLPTAIGAARPTCLAPETMVGGDLRDPAPVLLVGLKSFVDFQPHLIAANLQSQGFEARALLLEMPTLHSKNVDAISLARLFELPDFQAEFVTALQTQLEPGWRVGLPAVLGTRPDLDVFQALQKQIGCRCFEVPGLPPSIPGMRLHKILVQAIRQAGGQVYEGLEAIAASVSDQQVKAVWSEAAGRPTPHQAQVFVLATGGILGGGFTSQPSGQAFESVFGLPIHAPAQRLDWICEQFAEPAGHPIFQAGLQVDTQFRTPFENLYAIGNTMAGDFLRQRALEGVALVSGHYIGEVLA